MCLTTINEWHRLPINGVGFKGVQPIDKDHFNSLYLEMGRFDEWLDAGHPINIQSLSGRVYKSGFHFYTSAEDTKLYKNISDRPFCISPIEYEELKCVGEEFGKRVLVAQRVCVHRPSMFGRRICRCYATVHDRTCRGLWIYSPSILTRSSPAPGFWPVFLDSTTSEISYPSAKKESKL